MKLAISNIAWGAEDDERVYALMKKYGFVGLEIAPTRIFPKTPYEHLEQAKKWKDNLFSAHGFAVPSMQSIWFGRQEKMFGTEEERTILLMYTKKAIDFAAVIGCENLVFGCPRNRNMPDGADAAVAKCFFKELGEYAVSRGTIIGMEANPPIYNTNYINDTVAALNLIEQVESDGFKLNLDMGTMVENKERVEELTGKVSFINHVHISEPGLKPIEKRTLHEELAECLREENYNRFVSIEMGKKEDMLVFEEKLAYVKEIFG